MSAQGALPRLYETHFNIIIIIIVHVGSAAAASSYYSAVRRRDTRLRSVRLRDFHLMGERKDANARNNNTYCQGPAVYPRPVRYGNNNNNNNVIVRMCVHVKRAR